MKNNKFFFAIFFLLFFGFLLRLWGIKYGLPDLSHPDEARVILDTLSMGQRLSLLPARPDYSLLYRYLLLVLYGCYFLIGKLFGIFKDLNDFAFKFIVNPSAIYIITRFISVIFGTLTGLLAYILSKKFFNQTTALVSLIFVLFEFQLVQHSQWGIYPSVFVFTVLLAFYFMFKALKNPSVINYLFMGAAVGLSISSQNHGIFLLPSLACIILINFSEQKEELGRRVFFKSCLFLCASLFIFSLFGNLYWIFIFKKAALKYAELLGVTKVGFASSAPYANNILSMVFWFLKELIYQDFLLGIVLVIGIFYAIWKHTKMDIVFLVYLLVNLYIFSNWGFRLLHDMLGVMPILCIFGARSFVDLSYKLKLKQALSGILACIIVLPLVSDSITVSIKKNNPDTRQLAKVWIEQNIPTTEKIAIDWHLFNVPLHSKLPIYFMNPVAREYYDKKISSQIKEAYLAYLKDKPVYELTEVMGPLSEPYWPEDMPIEAKSKAMKSEVYKDLYSKFHFRSWESIKKEKVKYLIISSYLYGYFLLNHDSNKKYLFTPFIKDKIWLNYSQAESYIDDDRYGLIYFLSRDARSFYLPLLNNVSKEAVLIKEFKPDNRHLGPVIKIFKLN